MEKPNDTADPHTRLRPPAAPDRRRLDRRGAVGAGAGRDRGGADHGAGRQRGRRHGQVRGRRGVGVAHSGVKGGPGAQQLADLEEETIKS